MVLVFIFLGIIIYAALITSILLLATIKIEIKGKWKRSLFQKARNKRKIFNSSIYLLFRGNSNFKNKTK